MWYARRSADFRPIPGSRESWLIMWVTESETLLMDISVASQIVEGVENNQGTPLILTTLGQS